jgi:hypothetical protein
MSGSAYNVVQAAHIGSVTFVEPGFRPVVPAQAEPPPSAFVDRGGQLALMRSRAAVVEGARPAVVAVRGMQGVGKTALPRQFAATSKDMFPDGVLSVRLLVLLDDVTDAGQVSSLLPNSPRSMVLAAGNRVLEELYVEGAVDIALRPLSSLDGVR